MARNIKTNIYCYDDHRAFSEDVKKRFADSARYKVFSFPAREDLFNRLLADKEHSYCKIAILGVHDNKEHLESIEQMAQEIKKIDLNTGLILLGSEDKIDEIRKAIRYNIDACIPLNTNSVLRIHNIVKKLISEHNIGVFRKRRNISLFVLLAFFILSAFLVFLAWLKMPQYF